MAYRNKTYVCFDGDSDIHYYRLMLAWCSNENIDFNFFNAHDINYAYDNSQVESIKRQLRERMANSKQMIVLVGEKTKLLRKFIPWEIELAQKLNLPIVCANLNNNRQVDHDRCPKLILSSDYYSLHVSFGAKIIKFALDNYAEKFNEYKSERKGPYIYNESVYKSLGI